MPPFKYEKIELSIIQKKYDSLLKATERIFGVKTVKELIRKWIDQFPTREDVFPLVIEVPIEYTKDEEKLKQFMKLKSEGVLEIFKKRNNDANLKTG